MSLLYNVAVVLKFAWIPSHKGIVGIEFPDLASKEAANCFPHPNVIVSPKDLKTAVFTALYEKFSSM